MGETDYFLVRAKLPSGEYLEARVYNEADAEAIARALSTELEVKVYAVTTEEVGF